MRWCVPVPLAVIGGVSGPMPPAAMVPVQVTSG
jgi:hypothetical protein